MFDQNIFRELEEKARQDDRDLIVDCVIIDDKGKVFLQKRAPNRRMFPGCWETPGGHVDDGESIEEAIKREIKEELDLYVTEIVDYVGTADYDLKPEEQKPGDNPKKRGIAFIIKTTGDVKLEGDKVTESRWVDESELELLLENRSPSEDYIYKLVKSALNYSK